MPVEKKNRRYALLTPVLCFFVYFVSIGIFSLNSERFFPEDWALIAPEIIADVVVSLILGCWYWFGSRAEEHPVKLQLSWFGFIMLFSIFFIMYATSEMVGNHILRYTMEAGTTEVYTNMTGDVLKAYLILALTAGPVCEELLYRWLWFRHLRGRYSFVVSFVISTFLFTAIHGTWMHVPVTVALSLFLCTLYEVTHNLGQCILWHSVFNFLGITIAFPVNIGIVGAVIVYVISFASLILLYVYRQKIFDNWFKIGGLVRFEKWLDEKRKNLGAKDT